jgi:hypothetical protein
MRGGFNDPERCRDKDCEYQFPHKHGWVYAPAGDAVEAIVSLVEDPRAEVRDPDTGEVIFPATKGPLRLVGGTDA